MMFDATSTFVGVVGGIAMSFGGLWLTYHFGPTPRELAERRRAKWQTQYQKRVNTQRRA